jgi:capsular exopolysaccharide synthesis family protein
MMQEMPPNDVSLRDFLATLRRRRATVLQTVAILVALSVVFTLMTKPVYRTTTKLLVEGKTPMISTVDPNDAIGAVSMPSPGYEVDTHIEVLQSDSVMRDAFRDANIPYDVDALSLGQQAWVTVKQIGETNVVELDVDSHKAAYAARLASTIPDVYLKYITGNSSEEVQTALQWVEDQLQKESFELDNAQAELDRFRRRQGIIDLASEQSMRTNKAVSTEADLHRAEADVASNQARLASLIAARDALPKSLTTTTIQSNNQTLQTQKDDIAKLRADRVFKLQLYKENSVPIQQLDAQIAAAEKRLAETPPMLPTVTQAPNNIARQAYDDKVADARSSLEASQAELAEAKARMAGAEAALGKLNEIERGQAKLQREVDEHTAAVQGLAKNVEDLSLKQQITHKPIVTISPPSKLVKVAPRPIFNTALALLFGLVLGVGLAVLQEYLDDRINEPEEARALTQAPALGYVPLVQREEARLIADLTGGSTLESYRVLRSNVQFATVDGPVSSIMVTSTMPGEGKSVTACNLAVAMALDGREVILVDADLRRPTIHEKLKLNLQPGLTSVLLGRRSLEEALQPTAIQGLRALTCGPLPPNPAELLNSRAMRQLHDDLKTHAEVVIFDTSPCLATADAQVLSAVVDGVLYVVHLGETKKSAVRHSIELLRQAHARILGTVFNKIDLSANRSSYYYSQYGYYTSELNGKNGHSKKNGYLNGRRTSEELVTSDGAEDSPHAAPRHEAIEETEEA